LLARLFRLSLDEPPAGTGAHRDWQGEMTGLFEGLDPSEGSIAEVIFRFAADPPLHVQ
jgi:hypothetical protein